MEQILSHEFLKTIQRITNAPDFHREKKAWTWQKVNESI